MIRPIRQEDVEAVIAILRENQQFADGLDYTQWTHPTLVAIAKERVVGLVQAHLGFPYAIVTELSIARAHQNQGYGVRLMEHLETILRMSGVTAYVAHVATGNLAMAELAERWIGAPIGTGQAFLRRLL